MPLHPCIKSWWQSSITTIPCPTPGFLCRIGVAVIASAMSKPVAVQDWQWPLSQQHWIGGVALALSQQNPVSVQYWTVADGLCPSKSWWVCNFGMAFLSCKWPISLPYKIGFVIKSQQFLCCAELWWPFADGERFGVGGLACSNFGFDFAQCCSNSSSIII